MSVRYSESDYEKLQKRLAGQQGLSKPLNGSGVKSGATSQCSVINGRTTIGIKPMSINEAWFGKKIRTKAHRDYEERVLNILPDLIIGKPPYRVSLTFGFARTNSDIDNPTKIILDLLTKKYKYDDRLIYELRIKKEVVGTGNEYFTFQIESI